MQIKQEVKKIIPYFILDWYHYTFAFLGALIYGFPSRKLTVIGVTGTSGKSTTVDFLTKILQEAGHKVVSNSSVRFKVADKEQENNLKMGMPGRFFMQRLLWQGFRAGCNFAVIEVTSEGIRQHRHRFINFDTAVFTNLSPEHIESHGGFENYRNEKIKLFKACGNIHIINGDDENAQYFINVSARKKIIFSHKDFPSYSDILENIRVLGEFNKYNATAAVTAARAHGISLETCKMALAKVSGVPGRMEVVSQKPLVVVDYAHTPDQLEKVYKTFSTGNSKLQIRNSKQILNPKSEILNRKLICVLGSCGGGRDKWKRPELGRIAAQYCDEIFITNEDPYDENPLSIINEIESGFSQIRNYEKILDRKEAIEKAVRIAQPNDVVIITGKGSETAMCVAGGKKIPWDDRQIAREVLDK